VSAKESFYYEPLRSRLLLLLAIVSEGKNFIAITTSVLKLQPEQKQEELLGLNYAELNLLNSTR
jgi:hypothetical protein